MNTLKNSYSFTKKRSGGSRKSDEQKATFFRASASISTSAERRRNLQIQRRIRAASSGEVRETQVGSCEKKRCASAFRKRNRGYVFFHRRVDGATALTSDRRSKKTCSPPFPHGRRKQVALFLYAARACYRFCSTQLARPTRRTVAGARKHVRVPCRHAPRHPALRPGKTAAWSRRPCDQRRAWAVRNRCRANAHGSQKRMCRRCHRDRSCRVLRAAVPALALASTSCRVAAARSRCPCPCARPSCRCPYLVPCPPPFPINTPRLVSGARRRGNRWARVPALLHTTTTFRARIGREASARDLARPRRGTHRRSPSKRSARVGKASAHDRAEIGHQHQHPMGGMAAWTKMR